MKISLQRAVQPSPSQREASTSIVASSANHQAAQVSHSTAAISLYSSHLNDVYSQHHAFVDSNLFRNEDEMRKQLEQFAHCCMITAQEALETNRILQQDLFKKMVSADDLAARRPYGYHGLEKDRDESDHEFPQCRGAKFQLNSSQVSCLDTQGNVRGCRLSGRLPGCSIRRYLSQRSDFAQLLGKWSSHRGLLANAAWL